jgi:hypothetical protein
MEMKGRLAYLDRVEAELGETRRKLHKTEDALRDALAKLAAMSDMVRKAAFH